MRDALLHVPLYAAYGLLMWACFAWLPLPFAIAVTGSLVGYLRDVTQAQAHNENDIRTGWDFWNWSSAKQREVFIPIAALLLAAIIFNSR